MKMLTLDIEAYNAIKPNSVLAYLRQHGWSKREDFSDKAEIWVHSAGGSGQSFEVLLPISTDIPDYASRIDDVFRVLEVLEQRPRSEFFNDLVDVSAIAAEQQREILNLHFNFLSEHNSMTEGEASAKGLGSILESLQALFDSIGQVKAGRPSSFGKVAKEITDRTRLSILGTFKGSFGLRLALAPSIVQNQQLDLMPDEPLGELVIQEFFDILNYSQRNDFEGLGNRLIHLQRRSTSNYGKFLASLADANANVWVDWGSPNASRGGSATLAAADAMNAAGVIKKIEVEAPQEYQIVGELLTASKSNKTFEIRNMEDDRPFSGKIADEVIESMNVKEVELTIGNLYTATLREQISASQITMQGKIERLLIKIHPWYVG
jgi:hypothetical protein